MLTTKEAAEILGISPNMVARLCRQGKIYATLHGPVWAIPPESVASYARKPKDKGGRPRKGRADGDKRVQDQE